MTPIEMISTFVERINAHDADGVCALMEENHVFIDGLGHSVIGREAMRNAWRGYFAMVPDYWIRVERVLHEDLVVALFGKAGGTVSDGGRLEAANRWEVPAAWRAVVGPNGVALWQVFADNQPMREIMAKVSKDAAAP